MVERRHQLSQEVRYQLLRELQAKPELSQRELAESLGISVGKINYCLKALVEKGLIKARNFKNSKNKLAYAYYLTPRGFEEKAALAVDFLRVKLREVDALRREIDDLRNVTVSEAAPEPAEGDAEASA